MFTPPEINENNYSSERVDEEQTREVEATTAFVSDSNVVLSEVSLPKTVSSLFYKSSTDDYMLSMKTFFERPVKIASGNFAVGDTLSSLSAFAYTSPHDFINGVTLRSNKLAGFLGIRATSVVKIVVNATRFQQGRYMLCFTPLAGSGAQNGNSVAWVAAHTSTLIQRTQLPHVELDLNCDTEVELRIPFISCANFTPTASITDANQSFAVGRFQLFPYSSLVAGSGSTTAGFTVWHHFENVELIAPAIPQSGRLGSSSTKKRNAPTDVEKKQNNLGLISTPMQIATSTLNALTAIPGLSTYAKPAAWVTERLGKAASIFGWSRPSDSSTPCRMYRAIMPFLTTVDAPDTSVPMAYSAQNCVTSVSGFSGTDIDELDFKNFLAIFSYFKSFTFSTSNNAGDTLTNFNLNPNHYWNQVSGTGGKLFNHYQPLAFVAQYFAQWRGSIKFRIKFVKTEFHSGRIAIAFSPIEAGITSTTQTFATSDYIHREIIDLRESSEIEFVIPFVSSSPWKPTSGSNNNMGNVYIYCVDPLIAPSSVSNSITCLIEVAGGDDMAFSIPVQNSGQIPVFGIVPQSANITNKPNMCMLDSSTIGASSITDSIDNSAFCVGEHISSFRTLLKAFDTLGDPTETSNGTLATISILPFAWDYYFENASPVNPNWTSDLYGTMCSIFALSRGGVRLKFPERTPSTYTSISGLSTLLTSTTPLTNMLIRDTVNDYLSSNPLLNQSGLRNVALQSNGVFQDVMIPQYHNFHSRTNVDHMCNTTYQYTLAVGRLATKVFFTIRNDGGNPRATPLRACADDGNFGCFVSIPPMTGVASTCST